MRKLQPILAASNDDQVHSGIQMGLNRLERYLGMNLHGVSLKTLPSLDLVLDVEDLHIHNAPCKL
jgi:hypothetical protein